MSLDIARKVLLTESAAIRALVSRLDRSFLKAVDMLYRGRGRVIVIGMGKPGFIAQKISASLASTGSVRWQFEAKGVLRISRDHLPTLPEGLELTLIDAGAEDLDASSDGVTITTPPEKLESVRTVLTQRSVTVDDVIVELVPKNCVELRPAVRQHLEKLEEDLDALDDVQSISTNVREIH